MHILATYITDVDRVASGYDSDDPPGTDSQRPVAPWELGLPVGAQFSLDDLNNVMSEILTDDGAMAQLADATARYNAYRMNTAVEAWNEEASLASFVDGSVQSSAALSGYVLGNLEHGSEAAGKEIDERNKMFIDLTSDVVGLIPTGGTFTSFLADQARSAGKDGWMSQATGNEAAAGSEAFDAQQQTLDDLQTAMAVALLDSPNIDDATREDIAADAYPWFDDQGGFDPDVLDDGETLDDFRRWLRAGGAGDTVTGNIPDLSESYGRGIRLGKGSD